MLIYREDSEQYHKKKLGELSASSMKSLRRSAAHYKAWIEGARGEPTPAMQFGTAFHCAVLEPSVFAEKYAVEPEFGDCRRKNPKAARDAWRAENEGKLTISAEDHARIIAMRESIAAHPTAARLLATPGDCEVSMRWEQHGVSCRARADKIVKNGSILIDLKTTEDASEDEFARSCAVYRYHWQCAHYIDGARANDLDVQAMVLVAVEKEPPYAVAVHELDDLALDLGRASVARLGALLRQCVETGVWPAYAVGVQRLSLPRWASE